jgi:hypothetical protein
MSPSFIRRFRTRKRRSATRLGGFEHAMAGVRAQPRIAVPGASLGDGVAFASHMFMSDLMAILTASPPAVSFDGNFDLSDGAGLWLKRHTLPERHEN